MSISNRKTSELREFESIRNLCLDDETKKHILYDMIKSMSKQKNQETNFSQQKQELRRSIYKKYNLLLERRKSIESNKKMIFEHKLHNNEHLDILKKKALRRYQSIKVTNKSWRKNLELENKKKRNEMEIKQLFNLVPNQVVKLLDKKNIDDATNKLKSMNFDDFHKYYKIIIERFKETIPLEKKNSLMSQSIKINNLDNFSNITFNKAKILNPFDKVLFRNVEVVEKPVNLSILKGKTIIFCLNVYFHILNCETNKE